MNKWILLITVILGQACGDSNNTSTDSSEEEAKVEITTSEAKTQEEAEQEVTNSKPDQLFLGFYVGYFEGVDMDFDKDPVPYNKITIAIDSLSKGILYGHSIVAGNERPFSGPYTMAGDSIKAVANEPGDDRYDGVFTFAILPQDEVLVGTWKANNKRLAVSSRQYNLDKRTFSYDPNVELPEEVSFSNLYEKYPKYPDKEESLTEDVLKFNASSYELKKEDIENMYQGDLEVMRNAIYARHGYSFRNRKMRFIFDHGVEWYMPVSTDIRGQLTALEKKNIDLLKRYEQHAARYYDEFGR